MVDIGFIGLGHMGFRRRGVEAKALGVPVEIAEAVARLWEATLISGDRRC
jgi:hypothetical protein